MECGISPLVGGLDEYFRIKISGEREGWLSLHTVCPLSFTYLPQSSREHWIRDCFERTGEHSSLAWTDGCLTWGRGAWKGHRSPSVSPSALPSQQRPRESPGPHNWEEIRKKARSMYNKSKWSGSIIQISSYYNFILTATSSLVLTLLLSHFATQPSQYSFYCRCKYADIFYIGTLICNMYV